MKQSKNFHQNWPWTKMKLSNTPTKLQVSNLKRPTEVLGPNCQVLHFHSPSQVLHLPNQQVQVQLPLPTLLLELHPWQPQEICNLSFSLSCIYSRNQSDTVECTDRIPYSTIWSPAVISLMAQSSAMYLL
jgi:hypothetical protein